MNVWPSGLGATGSVLGLVSPLAVSGDVWFVDSATGVDDTGDAGKDERYPLSTLVQAVDNAADGDWILLASSHEEEIDTTLVVDKRLTIVGDGSSVGIPSARITCSAPSTHSLRPDARGVRIVNVGFYVQETSSAIMSDSGGSPETFHLEDCYFEMADGAGGGVTFYSVTGASAKRCTFKSARTAEGNGCYGVTLYSTVGLELDECVFDASEYGWDGGVALYGAINAHTDLVMKNLSLLRGSDVRIHPDSTGYWWPGTTQSKGRVVW